MKKGHDPACRELAEHFLPDGAPEEVKRELAQHIQDQIELWLVGEEFDVVMHPAAAS